MNPPLRLAQQRERVNCPLEHPGRELGTLNQINELADPPVLVIMLTTMLNVVVPMVKPMIAMVIFDHLRRVLPAVAWQHHIHLGGRYTAPLHLLDLDPDLGKTEPGRYTPEPIRRGSSGNQCPENHVAADSRGRVQNRKPCVRHRLTICLLGKPQANLG